MKNPHKNDEDHTSPWWMVQAVLYSHQELVEAIEYLEQEGQGIGGNNASTLRNYLTSALDQTRGPFRERVEMVLAVLNVEEVDASA